MKFVSMALIYMLTTAVYSRNRVPDFLVGDWSSQEPFLLQIRSNGMGEFWTGSADAMGIFLYDGHYIASKQILEINAGMTPLHFKYDPKAKTLKWNQSEVKNFYPRPTQALSKLPIRGPLPPITPPTH